MKNTGSLILLLALLGIATVPVAATADTATGPINVRIVTPLSISVTQSLNLGRYLSSHNGQGDAYQMRGNDNVVRQGYSTGTGSYLGGALEGVFSIAAAPNSQVVASFSYQNSAAFFLATNYQGDLCSNDDPGFTGICTSTSSVFQVDASGSLTLYSRLYFTVQAGLMPQSYADGTVTVDIAYQ